MFLGPEPGLGWQEGRGRLPQASREGDRWKTVVKQKVPSLSFSLDLQGTQYEGSQPAQPVKEKWQGLGCQKCIPGETRDAAGGGEGKGQQ